MKAMKVYIEGLVCLLDEEINCGVIRGCEIRWFGHIERIGRSEVTRRIYKGGVVAVVVKGRSL